MLDVVYGGGKRTLGDAYVFDRSSPPELGRYNSR